MLSKPIGIDVTMNQLLDLLKTRRSLAPMVMTGQGPDTDELRDLLTIASRVPDHGRLTPWRFIVFEGDGRFRAGEAIAAAFVADQPDADGDRILTERHRLARAPLVIGVVSTASPHAKIPDWEQQLSAGAVCMSFLIAAKAMGYAGCWLTEWYAYDRRVLNSLGLRPHERVAGFIHIGKTETVPVDRDRPSLDNLVTRF
jgi:nitroreductase